MKRLFLIILALAACVWPGTKHTASSVALSDVTTAYGLCSAGDTLAIPAGAVFVKLMNVLAYA